MIVLQGLLLCTLLVLFAHAYRLPACLSGSLLLSWAAFFVNTQNTTTNDLCFLRFDGLPISDAWYAAVYTVHLLCVCILWRAFYGIVCVSPLFFLSCTISHIHVVCGHSSIRQGRKYFDLPEGVYLKR